MKTGFRLRMTFTIAAVALACVIASLFINYYDSKQRLEQSYIQSLDEKMSIQAERFDEMMKEMYQSVREISHSARLHLQLTQYLAGSQSYTDDIVLSQELNALLAFQTNGNALYLYLPQYQRVFSSMEHDAVRELAETPVWAESSDAPFAPLYFINRSPRVSGRVYAYAHPVYDTDKQKLGVLCITLDERQLYYALLDPMHTEGRETYRLLAADGMVCSAQDVSELGQQLPDIPQQTDRMNANTRHSALYASVEAPFTHYRLHCQSDLDSLTLALRTRLLYLLMASILITILLVYIAQAASEKLSRPVEELIAAMDKVSVGDFTARAGSHTGDEFDTLREHFNNMISCIDGLMEQVVQERTRKKQAELNALQYQIKPHFIYNTLNSIRFAAVIQRNHKLAELLGAFISLMEASIQRNGAFILLHDEIELVRNYLSLQAFRYFDCFECTYDIQPEAETCFVPCLLLQPMVENAVFHGVDTKRNDNEIHIAAWLHEDRLEISIHDNGKGLEAAEDAKQDSRRLTGIGLSNVEQRLRLYYGEKAGFSITSQPGEGTTVRFHLPISHDAEEYAL